MAATDALCRSFLDLWWHFDPSGATAGWLGDFSTEGIRQHVAALRAIAAATEELEVEDVADEIDRTALLDHLRVLLFRFEHEHPYRSNPLLWTEHLLRSFSIFGREDQDEALKAAASLERLRALPGFCLRARESIRKPPALLIQAAREQLGELRHLIALVQDRFGARWSQEDVDTRSLLAEVRNTFDQLDLALAEEIVPDPDPYAGAIGEEEADRRLHHEHASIHNAGEVWRSALRSAEEHEQAVAEQARAIHPTRPWREVFLAACDRSGDAPADFAVALAEAREFALSRGVVAPAESAPLQVERIAQPGGSRTWAEYSMSQAGVGRISLGRIPLASFPWVAARFGEPGLHYHASITRDLPPLVRRHIAASSTVGGWGLYIQEVMAEQGLRTDPESQLIARVLMLRQIHLALVDIGLHSRQLTIDEAIGHLSNRVPFDRELALGDVRGLLADPLSGCAALLGHQELRRLCDDDRAARGERFELADFHRRLAPFGGMPIPLIRWGMGYDA